MIHICAHCKLFYQACSAISAAGGWLWWSESDPTELRKLWGLAVGSTPATQPITIRSSTGRRKALRPATPPGFRLWLFEMSGRAGRQFGCWAKARGQRRWSSAGRPAAGIGRRKFG